LACIPIVGAPGAGRTTDLRGGGLIDSGHHMAEDAPEELAAALVPFLAG
jgi:haloacetate dehalogenase